MSYEDSLDRFQEMLFKYTWEEFTCVVGVCGHDLRRCWKMGFISFNIEEMEEFNQENVVEVFFIKYLVQSSISLEYLLKMFDCLKAPYRYSHKDIFWDFRNQHWRSILTGEYSDGSY